VVRVDCLLVVREIPPRLRGHLHARPSVSVAEDAAHHLGVIEHLLAPRLEDVLVGGLATALSQRPPALRNSPVHVSGDLTAPATHRVLGCCC